MASEIEYSTQQDERDEGQDDHQDRLERERKDHQDRLERERKQQKIVDDLNDHFTDDFSKMRDTGRPLHQRPPYKFVISVLKIIFVTWQLVLFGQDRTEFAQFLNKNNIAMKHLLLKDWGPEHETMPYPPAVGDYAVYTIDHMKENINHTITQIYELRKTSVGSFFIKESDAVEVCIHYYTHGEYDDQNGQIDVDLAPKHECKPVGKDFEPDYGLHPTIDDLMRSDKGSLVRLFDLSVEFKVKSIYVRQTRIQCYTINGMVLYDNQEINGQIPVKLTTDIREYQCKGNIKHQDHGTDTAMYVLVILTSVASTICSGISLVKSICLLQKIKKTRITKEGKTVELKLTRRGKWQILRFRDAVTILSNVTTLIGTALKIYLDKEDSLSSDWREHIYNACGILLGVGCVLVWIGILHFLNFFSSFYLLFAVVENSAKPVLQFLCCIAIIYMGFSFCGWIVLGPYHLKFISLGSTIQTLLALLNGDEVFVTLAAIESDQTTAKVFNNIFNLFFIFLFTIIALNIFIAIFNTNYEEIQKKKNIGKESEGNDQFNGLSEIQWLLGRYQLPNYGKVKTQSLYEKEITSSDPI